MQKSLNYSDSKQCANVRRVLINQRAELFHINFILRLRLDLRSSYRLFGCQPGVYEMVVRKYPGTFETVQVRGELIR